MRQKNKRKKINTLIRQPELRPNLCLRGFERNNPSLYNFDDFIASLLVGNNCMASHIFLEPECYIIDNNVAEK